MSCRVDVLIVGAGPAGSAAAIRAAEAGLRVRMLERSPFPRHRPGETLHPGLASIFEQLGVADDVDAAAGARHEGQAVEWGRTRTVTPFGADADGSWWGYQVDREILDTILVDRAQHLGVDVRQPEVAREPIVLGGRVVGARGHPARFVIDAGGERGWLRRHLRLPLTTVSPPLRAYYGYCEAADESVPALTGDSMGWTWTAPIAPGRVHWTRLAFTAGSRLDVPPSALAGRPVIGRVRGADVTWRHVRAAAGPGYFLAGDAAAVLDPAASHGVLRALMTGIAASHAITGILTGVITERDAARHYRDWLGAWFARDVKRLYSLYCELQKTEGAPWQRQ